MKNFFKDLKVVELAGVLAGPSVGLFFAELGAEVIKIENKITGGDVTRTWKLPSENKNNKESAYFYSVNFFKKHIFLDLNNKKDKSICLKTIKQADILIVNYKKGDDKKLSLDYASLKKINPKLIYAQIHGFGANDNRLAYDLILQAESGFMSMNGTSESGPLKMPVALIDVLAAHQLKEAVLLALLKRANTSKGSHVSVSLFDAAIASLVNQATNWLIAGELPQRSGSLHPNIAPYGEIFETKDKHQITFAIGSDKQFYHLCEYLELNSLPENKKFKNNQARVSNRKELYVFLNDKISLFNCKEILRFAEAKQIPCGKIRNLKEVFELKEAKKLIRTIDKKNKLQAVTSVPFYIDSSK